MSDTFLDLLYADAPRASYDALREQLGETSSEQQGLALQIRERLAHHRASEAELSALYETANDLTAIRDLDEILGAIVRRARQLLHADMAYLSLNDEAEGASYMKVTDGALTPEFRRLRLPLGTGLLGLVAQTGAPYFTDDYQADARFLHRDYIDTAVAGEQIRAILGVPLSVDGHVIGALLAVHRTVRPFPPREVGLLTSFAAHASVALENARLFEQAREAITAADEANRLLRMRTEGVEQAARVHDRLTEVHLHGGGVAGIADVLAEVLEGEVTVFDETMRPLAGEQEPPDGLGDALEVARRSGHSVSLGEGCHVAVAMAKGEHLGTLVVQGKELGRSDRRTLERGAIVIALVLLATRAEVEAEERVRGELLGDLLSGRDLDPARLLERARRQGADLSGPAAVAVAEVSHGDLHRAARSAGRLGADLHGLAGSHQGRVVLLGSAGTPQELGTALHRRLAATGATSTVGAAALTGERPDAVAPAHAEASRCVDALLALGRAGEVADPAHLGLSRLLLGAGGPDELEDFIATTLGPLLAHDRERSADLVSTLEAWFAAGGSLRRAGARLHVHPNTVGQRLERIGRLLGEGWRDPDSALDLQLALRMLRLRPVSR